uniref:Amyloid beta A4 precursor protein-binding family B member 1-interacting protein n=1 Tax=Mola mola TaxID=94237 RepID=A0A3Q3WXZ3_MOLML
MDDIDTMFCHLLGEIDHLYQVRYRNVSLNELEDQDLDALVAGLGSEPVENTSSGAGKQIPTSAVGQESEAAHPPPSDTAEASGAPRTGEPQTKAEKVKLALEKLKEAKVRKLIIKVLMSDGSSKALTVDERQTAREVLDKLFEMTHCNRDIDWSLCESNPELQTERGFEDHEYLVEGLSAWPRHSQNKIYFLSKPEKYVMFTDPQLFYMWKTKSFNGTNQQAQLLIKENFEGPALIVPDLEGMLHLKVDDKKVWRPRYFVLRASGIYYVPKGKTKSSSDLTCFVRFEKVNVYTTSNYKHKYRAPTNFCFILKHPCIQRESNYIKFLCCDNEDTLLLWANSIRIAKYGTVLYKNYQAAVNRASGWQRDHAAANKMSVHRGADPSNDPPLDFIPPPPPPPPPPGHTQV